MNDVIAKDPAKLVVRPHLSDYDAERREFSWEAARGLLDGLPGGRGLNIGHEACDRHPGDRVAILLDGQVFREGSFEHVFDTPDPRVRAFYDYNFIQQAKS
mgnify:CR=1 FL=1